MHTLFINPPSHQYNRPHITGWDHAIHQLFTNVNKRVDYFRTTTEWLENNHPLIKLLKDDNTMFSKNIDNMLNSARNFWNTRMHHYGINSVFNKVSNPPSNMLYPTTIREYVVSDDSIPYGNDVMLNWRLLEPIKIIDHPYCDLNLCIPGLRFIGESLDKEMSATIIINVPMLVAQYKLWLEYEFKSTGLTIDNAPRAFLSRYPITNTLRSHLDIVIRNRLIAHYDGKSLPAFRQIKTGVAVVNDVSNYVDRSLKHCVQILKDGMFNFREMNSFIPQVSCSSVAESLQLPQMSYTRQCRWVYDGSRLRWLAFLLRYNNDKNIQKNIADIEFIKRRIKNMQTDREMMDGFNPRPHVYQELESLLR